METSSMVSANVEHVLIIQSGNCIPSSLPERNGNTRPHGDLSLNVCGSFICNGPKLETIQMAMRGERSVHTLTRPHTGVPLSSKKEQTTDTHCKWMNLKVTVQSERSQTKREERPCDSIYRISRKCRLIDLGMKVSWFIISAPPFLAIEATSIFFFYYFNSTRICTQPYLFS